jgi:type I restriction enzyme R subunit
VLHADYVLLHKPNIPLAVVKGKKSRLSRLADVQQAIQYALLLGVPFIFTSNGFVFRDEALASGVLEQNITLDQFPSPEELWQRYCAWEGQTPAVQSAEAFDYSPGKTAHHDQINANNRAVHAIAAGQKRVLLVMATGAGKTFTAFQIVHRLRKLHWCNQPDSTKQKRILFLADRNILIDQTMVNDFRPFKGAMATLNPHAKGIERVDQQGRLTLEQLDLAVNKSAKQVNQSYQIYLSLYQAVSGTEEKRNIYKQFSPEFFGLIVIDECHRGSTDEDSAWHEILRHFRSATHIGLTATPKETADLFLVLVQHILKVNGRAAIVLPDGTLFGEGVKSRINEQLLTECNLHTIARLPNGVFAPYTPLRQTSCRPSFSRMIRVGATPNAKKSTFTRVHRAGAVQGSGAWLADPAIGSR